MEVNYLKKYVANDDAIVFGLPKNTKKFESCETIDALLGGTLDALVESEVLSSKKGEITTTGVVVQRDFKKVIAIGLGDQPLETKDLNEVVGHFYKYLKESKTKSVQVILDTFKADVNCVAHAFGLMSELTLYEFDNYKTNKKEKFLNCLNLTLTVDKNIESEVNQAIQLGQSVARARNFSEMPPNLLYPESFASNIVNNFKNVKNITVSIKDEEILEREGYGLITAVGKASKRGPRLVTVEYVHQDARNDQPIVLVGKGITYDTGGYSIKTKTGMVGMKYDMSGAANVIGMIDAISRLQLPVHVIAIVGLAENMIDGNGMRPDDVYHAYSGHSVEVTNTDAEGRLVLADCLHHASKYSPKLIMDFATLTGAVIGAIGTNMTGTFTNRDRAFLNTVVNIGDANGEYLWHLPISKFEEKEVKSSNVADLLNSNGKPPGASFAAAFLKQFVKDTDWIHFDIAGTASQSSSNVYGPKGATGVMIRTIVEYIKDYCNER